MFQYDLCLALGWRSVREMRDGMDSLEFSYWMAYSTKKPLPEDRADMRSAMLAHTMVSCWSTGTEKIPIEQFLIVKPPRPQMDGDMLLAQAMNAGIVLAPLGPPKE